jgi:YHS domain-containing protein
MLKHAFSCVALLTVAVAIGCAGEPATRPTSQASTAPATQPVNKMCAVMPEDPVDPDVTTVYNGKVIGFCCKDCVSAFKKDPEKYVKNLK